MACDTIKIETLDADEVVSIVTQGPQGPSGSEAATLTTTGDLLYRAALANDRLPIGSEGQVLKVSSGIPAWGNESGAVTSVNGETGAVVLDAADIGAQSLFVTEDLGTITADATLTAARAKIYTVTINTFDAPTPRVQLPATNIQAGDVAQIRFTSFTGRTLIINNGDGDALLSITNGQRMTFIAASTASNSWAVAGVDTHTHAAADITSGTLDIARIPTGASSSVVCIGNDARLSDARTPTSHTHGNITNGGLVGTTAGLPLKTGTGGIVEAGVFGTGAGEFAEGNHTHTQLHDRSHAITSTSDHTAGNHKVFYSDGSGEIVELALGNSGEVLTSNGASAAPSFAAASGGGATNLWIPASAFIPKTTAGCGVDSRETATNDQNFDELLFDAGSDEFADALVVMPSNYNNGTITARFYWTAASGSGGVAWAIQGRALANDDALDTAAGTAQLVTDTLIAADDMHVTSATSAVTIGGTPAANTPIQFTIYRDVSDAADDLAVDARLLGVEIIFN